MRVLIDTNILISAILSKGGVPYRAIKKAADPPHQALICEYSLEELRRVFNRKFPHKIHAFERFIATALPMVEFVSVPETPHEDELKIRDENDRPIFRAAIHAKADILLSGDKDFTDSSVTSPKIMTPAQFVQMDA